MRGTLLLFHLGFGEGIPITLLPSQNPLNRETIKLDPRTLYQAPLILHIHTYIRACMHTVGSKKLEHGCIYPGFPSFFASRLEEGRVPPFWLPLHTFIHLCIVLYTYKSILYLCLESIPMFLSISTSTSMATLISIYVHTSFYVFTYYLFIYLFIYTYIHSCPACRPPSSQLPRPRSHVPGDAHPVARGLRPQGGGEVCQVRTWELWVAVKELNLNRKP